MVVLRAYQPTTLEDVQEDSEFMASLPYTPTTSLDRETS